MPLPRNPEQIVQHKPNLNIVNQNRSQQLENIAGESSFQDWVRLKDRNAIPNNAPTLLWVDVKPGKRIYEQPFIINDEGIKASYTNSYWNDPKRIARMHEVIDSAPEGWQAPEWLDVEGVENLYRYFEYRNPGSSWEDWKELPGDDPGIDLANYLDQPPQDILHYDDMDPQYRAYRKIQDWYDNYNKAQAEYQAALEQNNQIAAQMIEQQYNSDIATRWEDLELFQRLLLTRDSMTQIEGRPDWSRGIAAGWMGFKTGLSVMGLIGFLSGGIGTLAAPGPGTVVGAVVGGLAGLYTGYKAYMGEENELANLLNIFNLPAETVERIIGMIAIQREAAESGQGTATDAELSARWQASKAAYEAQVLPIGNWEANAVSKIAHALNPDWSSGRTADTSAGEAWLFEQGYVTPQVVQGGTMAGEALLEATARIQNGEDATLVYEDMVRKFGYTGTRADFVAQNFLDPSQLVPYLINKGGANIAGVIGDQQLRAAFLKHRGSILIDMLPMGWQQLATAVGSKWGWHSTGGIFDVLQDYGGMLRTNTLGVDGSYTLPENFSKFQIMIGQLALNKDGKLQPRNTIPDAELATPTNRILKALDWAGRATPETKAIMAHSDLTSALEHILQLDPNNPMKFDEMLHAIADADNTKFNEVAGAYLASPQLESIRGAVRDYLGSPEYEANTKIWQATQPKRQLLEELSIAATHDSAEPVTAAKVMDMLRDGQTAELIDLIKTNPITGNGIIAKYQHATNPETSFLDPDRYISPDTIERRLKTFIDGSVPWHPREFNARMLNKFVDSSTNYFVKRYDLKPGNMVMRLSTLLKSAQSLYLLGLSPNFFVNNLLDGIVTTSYYGVFGMKPLSQLEKFWTESELPIPARLGEGYSPADITHSIFTQLNPKDLLTEAQSLVSKVNKGVGIFTRLSGNIERIQGANAITLGAMHYLKSNWVEGIGFGKMPPDLEAKVKAAGIDPNAIYAVARSSKTPADFDKRFYGAYREGTIGNAVSEGARRPAPPAGPAETPEETLAKFDNAVKESADEFYTLDGQPLTADLIAKTGIDDVIIDNLNAGMDADSAIGSALDMVSESLERQRWADRLSRVESDNARVTAEGFKAAVQIFGEQVAENLQKSSFLRYRVDQEFEEVGRLHDLGLHSQAEAYKIEVVEELQRQQKIQADENVLRIGNLLQQIDPENSPAHQHASDHIVEIGKAWDEFYAKKLAAVEEFNETTRNMPWDPERYAAMYKEHDTKLNQLAEETREYVAGVQKLLDENLVEILGDTPERQERVRQWLAVVRSIEAKLDDMDNKIFKKMTDNPKKKKQIYDRYMHNEYMPMSAKLQDAYLAGATKIDMADEPDTYVSQHIDDILEQAGIPTKPAAKPPKTEAPAADQPKVVLADRVVKVDETDAKIERTIYIDQSMVIKRDTETRLKINQLEDAFLEGVKKAIPDMATNKGKQRLAMTWMRMRAETWAIDNDSTPLDYWRVYADIDNVKNTNDALSTWIKSYNLTNRDGSVVRAGVGFKVVDDFVQAVIRGTDKANFDTFFHEMIHPLLYMVDDATLDILAKHGGLEGVDEYKRLRDLRDSGEPLDAALLRRHYNAEEKIVEDALKLMGEEDFGTGLSGLLKGAFVKIRKVLVNLWKRLKRENQELKFSDEVKKAMETLVLGSENARRIYDDALKNLIDEQTDMTAGDFGNAKIMLGDGQYYSTHYAYIPLRKLLTPLVPGKLLDETRALQTRTEGMRTDNPEWFKPNELSDKDQQTLLYYETLKAQADYYDSVQAQRVKLVAQLDKLIAENGTDRKITNLEDKILKLTRLSPKEYDDLIRLRRYKANLEPVDYTNKSGKRVYENTKKSLELLEERLKLYGVPDTLTQLSDVGLQVKSIEDNLTRLETERKNSLSAYDDAMTRLKDNLAEIKKIRSGKSETALADLQKQLPPDATLPNSRIPIVQRDGTPLFDGTGLIVQLKKMQEGTTREPEQRIYTLDESRGDWVGQETNGDNELYAFEDSAMKTVFPNKENVTPIWEPGDRSVLIEYQHWVMDNKDTYGIKLTDDEILAEPGIIALVPEVDVRKFDDPNDLHKMLGWIESEKAPKVFGKFAGELDKYLTNNKNILARAYVAKITEAMVSIKFWDALANQGKGGWVSIADPRARKVEIEAAIRSERQTPIYGIQRGVLNVLEYALRKSFASPETEQFVFGFLRKPIEEFFESDRASATANLKKGEAYSYEATDERLRALDKKIEDRLSLTDPLTKKSNDYPKIDDVVRNPFIDMDQEVQSIVHIQMRRYQEDLKAFLKRLDEWKKAKAVTNEPEFLQSLEDSFVYKIPALKQMYKSRQVTLPEITKALNDIVAGKYDPDSGLHQTLLRAALRANLDEPALYNWLGVWKYEVHIDRIQRLSDNVTQWALRIKNAATLDPIDTSVVSPRATTDMWNQYRHVADALQRTKKSGLHPLSKAEMNEINHAMDLIKKRIETFATMRKAHDMTFRDRANMVRKYEVDTKPLDARLEESRIFNEAERGDVKVSDKVYDDADDVDVTPRWDDAQLNEMLGRFTREYVEDADLEFAQFFLKNYGLTKEMLDQLEPLDTIRLLGKTYDADETVESLAGVDKDSNAFMLAEYNKLLENRQAPAEPAESGYATQMMNNPTGTTPVPMMSGYAGLEVFDTDLYPLLSSIRDKMRNDMRNYKMDGLNNLDGDTKKAFQDWLNTTRINLAETRRGAVDWGITQRDNALLNYSNRTNLDAYAELAFPYQFWFTRSLGNWARRMISKPAMVGQMVRRQQMMQKNGKFWGNVPKRLQGKMVIPHAFSEPWMGNFMYINPWQNLFPPFNLLSSVNSFNMQAGNANPMYTLQDMVAEGEISQEEMDEALKTQSGANWDKAYARAIEESNADMKNPVTLASMMMSPSLWITEMFGDKPAENLPSTKLGTAVRSFGQRVPGILGPVADMLGSALEAPEKLLRGNNFAYYGKWGDYKINRMIANMVADGTLDYDQGMLAMINKSGPDYELAQQRLESELSMKVAGSSLADTIIAKEWTQIPLATLVTLFPGGLYPIGEEEGMQLKAEMQAAWDELGKGNPYPINNFFNEHEGHLVRTGINDGPELQMKKFLAHNIREKYDALDPINKGLIKVQLGESFVKSLLSGEIEYDKLTKQDLTIWLDAIGGKVPDTEVVPQTQRVAPDIFNDDEVKQITTYMDLREQLYPNHAWLQQNYGQLVNELDRKKYLAKFPELKRYWDWNRKYKHDHPIIGEWSSYYGNPNVGDSYQDPFYGLDKKVIQSYLDEKRQRFPDQEWQQEVYFSLPTDEERYAFIDANPSLADAWEWDQAITATNPSVAMYKQLKEAQHNMASNEPGTEKTPAQVSKNLALLDIHPFAIQELVISHSTGDPLSAGTRAELLRLFQSMGEPGSNFEDWIDSLF